MHSLENNNHKELFVIYFEPTKTNFKYSTDLIYKVDFLKYNYYLFEVFETLKNKLSYFVAKEIFNLNIYLLHNNKLYKKLKHSFEIICFKYYTNNSDKEFLLCSILQKIFIYDPSKEFDLVLKIDSNLNINNTLLIFNIKRENYIIYSTFDNTTHDLLTTSVFLLKNGKNLENTININNSIDKYLIYWKNRDKEKDYLILLCVKKVLIIDLFENEVYSEINSEYESAHFHGFIYSKNNIDYLCFSSFNGYITIYDLYKKEIYKNIICPKCNLIQIVPLVDNYVVSSNFCFSEFIIVDIEQGKVISSYRNDNKDCIYNLKIINYKNYGKCILTCGTNKSIHLWKPLI